MKKNGVSSHYREGLIPLIKIVRIMKVFMFFMLVAAIHLSANSYSQTTKISLDMNNVTIKQVLQEIENQTEFRFLYSDTKIDVEQKVNVNIENSSIQEIFKTIFDETGISYEIRNRQILLSNSNPVVAAQKIKVIGKVTDTSGQPLPGVTVVVKGTTNGTISNFDGVYNLSDVPSNAIIQFSFVGMKMQEIEVAGKTSINIEMEEDAIGIEEVVAIGYGTMKKSDLTGSVSSVKDNEIGAFPSSSLVDALKGRAAGVQISQHNGAPGGSISVRIRGTNSILGSNEPLYVIDGIIASSHLLNNADIESIEILKDASATAIYGSQGANGVVLITTKKGKKGISKVQYQSSYGVQSVIKKMDLMDATQYATLYNEQTTNDGLANHFTSSEINALGEGFDWQDAIFRQAAIQEHNLSISESTERTQFYVSGSIFKQDGIIKSSGFDRYSFRINLDHKISEKLSVNTNAILTNEKASTSHSNIPVNSLYAYPTVTPYDDDGNFTQLRTVYAWGNDGLENPVQLIDEYSNVNKLHRQLLSVSLLYSPIKDLTIKIMGAYKNLDSRADIYNKANMWTSVGNATVVDRQSKEFSSENTLTYDKKIGKHTLSVLAGFTYGESTSTSLRGDGSGFLSNNFETNNLNAAASPGIPESNYSSGTALSGLSRINYKFEDKYLATVTFRADGASVFSEGNKWGYFPSTALAWRISEEDFLKDVSVISDLKLRLGWGVSGSQAISAYSTLDQLYSGKTVFGNEFYTNFAPSTTLAGDLKWETTEQTNIGLDANILDSRLYFSADYYIKNTRDLLNTVSLPTSMGYASTLKNIGKIQNKGIEFQLGGKISIGRLKWDIDGNISFNKNKVIELYNGEDILGSTINKILISDVVNVIREGEEFGVFLGYLEDGYDENGSIKYQDMNDDGSINNFDKTIIGNPNPDFIYGLNSRFSFENFELTLFLQGTQGNDIFNLGSVLSTFGYQYGNNMPVDVYNDHWTSSNTNSKYPRPTRNLNIRYSDRMVEDGSYLRLKNIQLAYNFPISKLKATRLKNAQIYVSGQNLLTFTKYSWWDPDVNASSGINQGLDNSVYPSAKTITMGVRVTF